MSGIKRASSNCDFCGQAECDCPYPMPSKPALEYDHYTKLKEQLAAQTRRADVLEENLNASYRAHAAAEDRIKEIECIGVAGADEMSKKKILTTVMPKNVSAGNFTNEINLALVKFGLSFEKIYISMQSGAVISGFNIIERTLSDGSHEYDLQLVTE